MKSEHKKSLKVSHKENPHIISVILLFAVTDAPMCTNLEFTQMDHSINAFSESKLWFKYIQRFLQNKLDNCFQNHYKNYLFLLNYISQLLELWFNIFNHVLLSLWSREQVETEKIKHPLGKLTKLGHNENIPEKQAPHR